MKYSSINGQEQGLLRVLKGIGIGGAGAHAASVRRKWKSIRER